MATPLRLQLEILSNGASATVGELRRIREESARTAAESRQNTSSQQQGNTLLGGGIAELAFRYNNVVGALQNLRATAQPVYDALIASNEKLNAQILSSQTNLASSTRLFKSGVEITDPTEKIKASAGSLRAAIKQIEIDTQSLVGVTSAQVNELFQITLTNAGALNNQSKQFPDAIQAATQLTKGWAASLKVVGIPLNQARQEINSIIKGQITQDSLLAKNLNISNQQVESWRSQGKLVDELNKRLEVFVAGNGIAARSIEGISSNILDLSERISRNVGEPLLEPIIDVLAKVEAYLKRNETAITDYFKGFSEGGRDAINALSEFEPLFKLLEQTIAQVAPIVGSLFNLAIEGAVSVGKAIQYNLSAVLPAINKVLEGYKLILEAIQFRSINDAAEALEEYGRQVGAIADSSLKTSSALDQLNKIKASGGQLTAEQLEQEKKLQSSAQSEVNSIDEKIKALKEVRAITPELASLRDNEIKQLEALREKLDKSAGGLKIEAKLLEDLGSTSELAAKKLADFNRQIKSEAGGDKAAFETALKGKVALIQSEVAQKRVLVDAARIELESVRDNTKADLEIRNSAKEAIDKLYDGRIAKVKELIEVGNLQAGSGLDELAKIRDDAQLEAATRRKAGQQIVSIRKEQIAAESAAIAAGQSQISAHQSQQRIGEAAADEATTKLKLAEVAKRIEGIRAAEANATSDTERSKLKAEAEKEAAESEKLDAELSARRRKRALEDFDERRNLIKAQNDLGLIDRGVYNQQILLNDIAQNDTALAQQQQALAKLGASDKEGREVINSQIAQLQSKRVEIARTYDQADLKRQTEYYDQALTSLEAFKNQRLISEEEFIKQKSQNRIAQTDAEITVAKREIDRLGANDIEGRNALNARINELGTKRLKALEESYAAELVLIRDAQTKALDLVNQSEQQRSIDLQKLVNNRSIRQEDSDRERSRQNLAKQRAELNQARDFEAALARTVGATRSPEGERAYQQQVREARGKTLSVTLQLLQVEGTELERLRTLALKGIEDEVAARARSVDLQLSQIAAVKGARERASKDAEANASREVFALELVTKTLDRQNSLLIARNNLQKANFDAAISGNDLDLARVNRALEIKLLLDSNVSTQERIVLMRELAELTQNSGASEYQLVQQKLAIEQRNGEVKRENILFEQAAARAALGVEQQKIELGNQRAVIEARIAELKAKQSILDAESLLRERKLTDAKAIDAANLALEQARAQQPGKARDRAVADAGNKLQIVKNDAVNNQENAVQSIDLARQQADFASQTTKQAIEQVKSFGSIKDLQTETLRVQQGVVLKQLEAAEAAKRYADELERAKAALTQTSTTTAKPLVFEARAGGGSVNQGQPYVVGEREPEVFVPNVSGTVLNREQILKNLGSLGGLNLNVAGNAGSSNREVVDAVRSLEQTIKSRPPAPIVANFNSPDDGQLDKMFKIQRAALRV
jgi:hypothetical protein